ncbi:MAG: hypothetical protein AB7G23_17510 [Vicinamibacterales bacterium]
MRMPLLAALIATLVCPSPASAWGFEAHKLIMDRAIALLPDEVRPFFQAHRAALVERSIDPDTWRTVGFEQEPPNHFLDIDWQGHGPYPFAGLPRDLAAAVEKFGRAQVDENGTVPWRAEEFHGRLTGAFEAYARRGPFGAFDIVLFAATLAHYVSDAHVPLHAVVNYDGQLTGQRGVHARFESFLFERYRESWQLAPTALPPVSSPRDFIFDRILEGTRLVPAILEADRRAIGTRDVYDDAYYDALQGALRPVMEQRLNESIAAVAAFITGAWEAAGRPAVPVQPPPLEQRRRRD